MAALGALEFAGGILAWLIYWLVVWLVTVFIHEAGHAGVATLLGFRVSAIEAGPLRIQRAISGPRPGPWELSVLRRNVFGGITMFRPTRLVIRGLALRYAVVIACGSLANAAFAAVILLISHQASPIASRYFGVIFVMAGAAVGTSLVPFRTRRGYSDGLRLIKLSIDPDFRNSVIEQLLFIERLRKFKVDFAAQNLKDAARELDSMKQACAIARDNTLQRIVEHLQEHLNTGESMEKCEWSPSGAGLTKTA